MSARVTRRWSRSKVGGRKLSVPTGEMATGEKKIVDGVYFTDHRGATGVGPGEGPIEITTSSARLSIRDIQELPGAKILGSSAGDAILSMNAEIAELENSVRHLVRSNKELHEADPNDEDFKQAIAENQVVIKKKEAQIKVLKTSIQNAQAVALGSPPPSPQKEAGKSSKHHRSSPGSPSGKSSERRRSSSHRHHHRTSASSPKTSPKKKS